MTYRRSSAKLAFIQNNFGIIFPVFFLITYSLILLNSIAPFVFPTYFFYIFAAIILFIFFSHLDFDIIVLFYKHFYVISILLLLVTLGIGQVTRGAVRWIPIGSFTIQPTEIVRPFLLIFFAKFLSEKEVTFKRLIQAGILFFIPFFLIWYQPSLGVAIMTTIGFIGVVISSQINKRLLLTLILIGALMIPAIWLVLAPYQKARVMSLISKEKDASGAGYNSIQAMISVGSGKFSGRGLGQGIQTQLAFLPERHTDFVFASTAEELGFVGTMFLLGMSFFFLYRVIKLLELPQSLTARCFITGVFLTFFVQIFVHVGMNMGLLPITGLPFPLVSAGGSSLVATMATIGILVSTKKK